jgi:hypothetical protein
MNIFRILSQKLTDFTLATVKKDESINESINLGEWAIASVACTSPFWG